MKKPLNFFSIAITVLVVSTVVIFSCQKDKDIPLDKIGAKGLIAKVVIENWPATSKMVAEEMLTKYGQPQGVTQEMLVWNNNGPWKKTIVNRDTVAHNFPTPHADLLEQVINYKVPVEKYDDMAAYDGSVILERTKGEMSARCDKEGANFLAINLANDVAMGSKSISEARDYYTNAMKTFMNTAKMDPYMEGFKFNVPSGGTKDPDVTTF